jgi:hypothetical protein
MTSSSDTLLKSRSTRDSCDRSSRFEVFSARHCFLPQLLPVSVKTFPLRAVRVVKGSFEHAQLPTSPFECFTSSSCYSACHVYVGCLLRSRQDYAGSKHLSIVETSQNEDVFDRSGQPQGWQDACRVRLNRTFLIESQDELGESILNWYPVPPFLTSC